MVDHSKINDAVIWYKSERYIYEGLAKKVESIVKDIVESEQINYYSITSRAKEVESYKNKAEKEKYADPISEIFDMAGIRIITYTDKDAKRVHEIIRKSFELHRVHTVDKTEELGVDRVGYRSFHCVGTLGKDRTNLPENKNFKNKIFEIQIRTILQHAWAEFEHDRNYKFQGVLPKEIERRLSITAGTLELIDREFDEIAKAIDEYISEVLEKTKKGDLDVSIDSKSLQAYMESKFALLFDQGLVSHQISINTIEELEKIGIKTLKDFDKIIPDNFIQLKIKYLTPRKSSNIGLVRDLIMIKDPEKILKYYSELKEGMGIPEEDFLLINNYVKELKELINKYDNVEVIPINKEEKDKKS